MKITKLKITYINNDTEEIQLGKKWVTWEAVYGMLIIEGIKGVKPPSKVSKHIPLSSILNFIVEETDG